MKINRWLLGVISFLAGGITAYIIMVSLVSNAFTDDYSSELFSDAQDICIDNCNYYNSSNAVITLLDSDTDLYECVCYDPGGLVTIISKFNVFYEIDVV